MPKIFHAVENFYIDPYNFSDIYLCNCLSVCDHCIITIYILSIGFIFVPLLAHYTKVLW